MAELVQWLGQLVHFLLGVRNVSHLQCLCWLWVPYSLLLSESDHASLSSKKVNAWRNPSYSLMVYCRIEHSKGFRCRYETI